MDTEYALSSGMARAREKWSRTGTHWRRFGRRIRAVARVIARHHRARQHEEDLRRLDERTLRDLGITHSEIPSVIAELAGRAGATRRRIDAHESNSASTRIRVRAIDHSL